MSGRQLQLPEGSHAIAPAPFHDAPPVVRGPGGFTPLGHAGTHVPGGWFGGAWGVWPANTVIINNQTGWPGGGSGVGPGNMPMGVTDGSDARPGQVGEFISLLIPGSYAAGSDLTQVVNVGVLTAGDWTCFSWLYLSGAVTTVGWGLQPQISGPGISNGLGGYYSGAAEAAIYVGQTGRINIPSQLQLIFNLVTFAPTAGTFNFQVEARRAR